MSALLSIHYKYKSFKYILHNFQEEVFGHTNPIPYNQLMDELERNMMSRINNYWEGTNTQLNLFSYVTHIPVNIIANEVAPKYIAEGENKYWLCGSISNNGIKTPLMVFSLTKEESDVYQYFVLDGSHRLAVAKKLGISTVPALVFERYINGT